LFFPDWKLAVNFFLLFGLATGVVVYSFLTAIWAAQCEEANYGDLPLILRKLSIAMFGHCVLATMAMRSPSQHLNVEDLSLL